VVLALADKPFPASEDPVDLVRLLEITGQKPEMFRSLAHDYLAQADEILTSMAQAIQRRSAGELHQLAHKLRGSSSTCGMRAIVDPLAQLEQIGKASLLELAVEVHQDAVGQLWRIRQFLGRYLDGSSSQAQPTP
jgi:HPt (histidine-containing phosphotransfer) domain-containing protein